MIDNVFNKDCKVYTGLFSIDTVFVFSYKSLLSLYELKIEVMNIADYPMITTPNSTKTPPSQHETLSYV